jgi:hypothetical protein
LKGTHPGTIPARFGLIWKNLFLVNYCANINQTLLKWFLDGPLPNCVRWSRLPTKMAAKLKNSQKNPEYMLNYSLPCSCS